MSRLPMIRPLCFAAFAVVLSVVAAGSSHAATINRNQLFSTFKPNVLSQIPCTWVTYTTPYLYKKNTCTGEVQILLH